MPEILREILATRRRPLTIWAVSLGLVSAMYSSMYPYMERMDLDDMLAAFPPEFMEIMGYDDLGTASGYIGSAVFGLVAFALILVFAIGNGGGLVAGREEDGGLELELTSPVPRGQVYLQRLAALWVQVTLLVVALLATTAGVVGALDLAVPAVDLLSATFGLWLTGGFFGSVAFATGAATGRRSWALAASAALAVVGWMLNAIGPTVDLDWMSAVSPVGWYMAENPMTGDFDVVGTCLLAGGAAAVAAVGFLRFRARDLMT